MKHFSLSLLIFCSILFVSAQDVPQPVVQVISESASIRALPDETASATASVFANDSLLAVGRNLDGEWIEVRRPGRRDKIGWIARRLTAFTFSLSQLPMTDLTTGLLGTEPVIDTGYAIMMINEGALHTAPNRFAAEVVTVPLNVTVPVLERTPDNQWLKINYRGYVGWMAESTTRTAVDINTIPVSPEYAGNPDYAAYEIIALEVQIAQIDRLVAYITPINTVVTGVVDYWRLMSEGETLECLPPAGNFADYNPSPRDLVELPELRRQTRLLTQAIDDVNAAISAMQRCGVYTDPELRAAYANAINAQGILNLILVRMDNLRTQLGS